MKKIAFLMLVVTPSAYAQVDPSEVGSLYRPAGRSPIASRTAARKGDLVTILISEQSAAQFAAQTTSTRTDTGASEGLTAPLLSWLKIPLLNSVLGATSSSGTVTTTGVGNTSRSSNFTAKITVTVKEELPNGTLVLEGQRFLKVNNETQSLVLTGIVRRDDVRPDNSVLSESLANVEIKSEGKGAIAERQRRGFITRLLEWLF